MEKRLPLFLFLSLLILFAWNIMNPRRPPAESAPAQAAPSQEQQAQAPPEEPPQPEIADAEERVETLRFGAEGEPGEWRMVVSNRGARIVSLDVGGFYKRLGLSDAEKRDPENWVRLVEPVVTADGETGSLLLHTRPSSRDLAPAGLDRVLWQMTVLTNDDGSARGVEWRYGPGAGIVFTKRVTSEPGSWRLLFELEVENGGASPARSAEFLFEPAACVPAELGDKFYDEPRAIAVGYDAKDEEYSAEWKSAKSAEGESGALDVPAPLVVAGVHNKYFALLVEGRDEDGKSSLAGASYRGVRDQDWLARFPGDVSGADRYVVCDVNLTLRVPSPGEKASFAYSIYAGPKDPALLASAGPAYRTVQDSDLSGFAMFSTIGEFLLVLLRFIHRFVGNWGVAIILLTICVRAALFPINRRSQTAMARYQTKMKRVQPLIEEAKKRYEGNPQKLREAQAKIMQEEGAFPPLGGCLPVFLQIPIFIGLFSALRTAFELRQAPFALWIDDLSRPDRLFEIGLSLPLVGEIRYFNLLPILMVVLWIVQQLGMPKPADEQAARIQKMMMFMPVVMGVFLYGYAAGLSLYMITQSALGIVEQRVIKKLWPIDEREVAKKKEPKGCGPLAGTMERLAEKQREEMQRRRSGLPSRREEEARKREKKRSRRL